MIFKYEENVNAKARNKRCQLYKFSNYTFQQ